ncbi:PilZ domain-containing protein [Marinimicrobium sp. ABcell2]|uniref:PilZ domain-containing protein n=1 Tax=Marinimicrobium sp. ABcell2 TaxID=3069751 RepID=UPI0027B0181B|nr:PilZ domain-containing protein [Marinimicrobium sp. ABcell2]MDQ2075984.1 PilZ domain-containing protein [Marinimicrobium sp. ABcell2]
MPHHPQERRFSRIYFDARVELEQGKHQWQGNLLDISLNGLLMVQQGADRLDPKRPLLAQVQLDAGTCIIMHCRVAHQEAAYLGLACESIDVDSITHLRRLLELNTGDPHALERELSELITG